MSDTLVRPAPRVATAAPAPFRLGYRPALDGLRAVAVLVVMGFHAGSSRFGGGYLGVDVFFVLSGFLITALLVQESDRNGRIRLRAFYARRALRLLPALALMLAAAAVFAALRPRQIENLTITRDVLGTAFYVANWVAALHHRYELRLLSHTWSLSIEEQFYLLWPACVVLILSFAGRRGRWVALAVALDGFVLSNAVRSALWHRGSPGPRVTFGLDTRGGTLLLGCALGLIATSGLLPRARAAVALARWGGLAGFAYLLYMFLGTRYAPAALARDQSRAFDEGYLLVAVASALVILGLLVAPKGVLARVLSIPPVVWIGQVSYGLYLWHYPIDRAITPDLTGLSSPINQAVRLGVTFAVVTASYYLVERPFLRLKRRVSSRADLEPGVLR